MSIDEELPIHQFVKLLYGKDAPRPGELVIGRITDIQDHGIYLYLPEYDKSAYVPLKELGRGIVRSPRQHYKINQTVVAKVYKTRRGIYINASLRRLSQKEANNKLAYWRKLNRSAHLAKLIARELNISLEEVIDKIYIPLIECYETPFDGLEDALIKGKRILEECGVATEFIDAVYDIAKKNILIKKQRMKFTIEISTLAPDGIIRIKKALLEALSKFDGIEAKYESAPRYSVWVEAFERTTIRNKIRQFAKELEKILMEMPDASKYKTMVRLLQ